MRNLKLALKIGIGFGILLAIACILGGMAVINMRGVEESATKLAAQYIPEVAVANNVERHSLLTMYAWRGYSLSEDPTFLEAGKKELARVQTFLADAKTHADKYTSLSKLRENVSKAQTNVEAYARQADATVMIVQAMQKDRVGLDAAAAAYMKSCHDYLKNKEEALAQDIAENAPAQKLKMQTGKLVIVNEIINLGNDTRIKVWKSQALREPKILDEALENFPKMEELFAKLRSQTQEEADIARIVATRESALAYKTTMTDLLKNWNALQNANTKRSELSQAVLEAAQETAFAGMEHTADIAKEAVQSLTSASLTMIIGLVAALVLGTLVSIFLTKGITGPIIKGVAFAKAMANGDFTRKLDIDQKDEIGILAASLNEMVGKLREVVAEIQSASENVAAGSEELSASAQSMETLEVWRESFPELRQMDLEALLPDLPAFRKALRLRFEQLRVMSLDEPVFEVGYGVINIPYLA